MQRQTLPLGGLVGICVALSMIYGATQNFIQDVTFKGSSLNGWHSLGAAEWRADNGEIIAAPRQESGGWLMLDHGYQDIQFTASFRAAAGSKAGSLLRAEKTADSMKGIFISLVDGDVAPYNIILDAQGKELSRSRLRGSPGSMKRMATERITGPDEPVPGFAKLISVEPPPPPQPAPAASSGGGRGGGRGGGGPQLRSADWNSINLILDTDILYMGVNSRQGGPGATTDDRMMGFGPLALYAGGVGEVRFKDIAYKDLNAKFEPKEEVSPHFRMQRISDFYYGWCAAAADINRDGILDVISGPFYYLGPDYTMRHEFTTARTYSPSSQFSQAMVNFAHDFTGDGWPDILLVDQRPIYLYVNPRGESRRWDRYNVVPQASTEIELLKDIDGDGQPDVLFGGDGAMEYASPNPANPTAPWIVHQISEKGRVNAHGMGVGDVNGDGRMDVVAAGGWWEQPPKGSPPGPWSSIFFLLREQAEQNIALRDALPVGSLRFDDGKLTDVAKSLLAGIAAVADASSCLERFKSILRDGSRPTPDGHFFSLDMARRLTLDTLIRRRNDVRVTSSKLNEKVILEFAGNGAVAPLATEPALHFIGEETVLQSATCLTA